MNNPFLKVIVQLSAWLPVLILTPIYFVRSIWRWIRGTYWHLRGQSAGRPVTPWQDTAYLNVIFWLQVWRVLEAHGLRPEDLPLLPRPVRPKVAREPEALPRAGDWFSGCDHLAHATGGEGAIWWVYRVLQQDPNSPMPQRKAQWLVCCAKCLSEAGGDVHQVFLVITAQTTNDWSREALGLPLEQVDVPASGLGLIRGLTPEELAEHEKLLKEDDHV